MPKNKLPMLALADLAGKSNEYVYNYILEEFKPPAGALDGIHIIIAYASVGSWGCDSSAFIIFKKDGRLYEVNGNHCSCMGFEGQWEPEEVPDLTAVLKREDYALAGGGYDSYVSSNAQTIRSHLKSLFWSPPSTDIPTTLRSQLQQAMDKYNLGGFGAGSDLARTVQTIIDHGI